MLCLEIRFLTGRYAAGRHDDTAIAEWPPHPARIYSALTDALHAGSGEPNTDERHALEWLASEAGTPEIAAPEAHQRRLGDVFVPVNDSRGLDSIDRYLLTHAEASAAVLKATGNERVKAEKKLAKAEEKLRERSAASTEKSRLAPGSAAELLDRPRHARSFPVALPADDVAYVEWPEAPAAEVFSALDGLCSRVTRLGHSSSLVSMRLVEDRPEIPEGFIRWAPDPEGGEFIRIPHTEQLRLLEEAYEVHQGAGPRVLPARPVRYSGLSGMARPEAVPVSEFAASEQDWIIYEVVPEPGEGRRNLLDLSLAQRVARALRGTLLSALGGGASEIVGGHGPDGRPTERTHVAYVPLADVGHRYASGAILGVAIVPPRSLETRERDDLLEAVFLAERRAADQANDEEGSLGSLRLTLGRSGVLRLQRMRDASKPSTLDPGRWCGFARRWTTATAVALDRNPGDLLSADAEEAELATRAAESTIADACENIGLPRPVAVWIHRRSLLRGAPEARRFAPFPDGGGGPRRVCIHAEVDFGEAVRGPVLLGAGRYFGLGLAVPHDRSR